MKEIINIKSLCDNSGVSYHKVNNNSKRKKEYRTLTEEDVAKLTTALLEGVARFKKEML